MQDSKDGMVCAAHPLAIEAGWSILNKGGTAYDAAVAVSAVLNVVEPMMSGIGGYGTILVYDAASKKIEFLNASGRLPEKTDGDAFRPPTANHLENRRSAKAVSTPVNLHAWAELAKRGKLAWNQLLETGIRLAEDGFATDERLAFFLNQQFPNFPDHAKNIYGDGKQPVTSGELLRQTDLANSFKQIASEGVSAFYTGEIGHKIVESVQNGNGFLSAKDLEQASAEWYEPIQIPYRGHQIYTAAPPATSFPGLIRLGLLAQHDLSRWNHNNVEHLHHFAEITKHAFWCRLNYAGDPDIEMPPLDKLFSDSYLTDVVSKIDPLKATRFEAPNPSGKSSKNTTHFVVADKAGNIVCSTQTIGQAFGSRIMPEGTGIWLNNSLEYCTFEPAGNPMDAHAGRHKLSGDMPTIITKGGRPWAALGTPGGHTIGQTVPQLVSNLIDFGMDIQTAIDTPRITFIEPNALHIEKGIHAETAKELANLGHEVVESEGGIGFAHGLSITYDEAGRPSHFKGGFDSRGAALVG